MFGAGSRAYGTSSAASEEWATQGVVTPVRKQEQCVSCWSGRRARQPCVFGAPVRLLRYHGVWLQDGLSDNVLARGCVVECGLLSGPLLAQCEFVDHTHHEVAVMFKDLRATKFVERVVSVGAHDYNGKSSVPSVTGRSV